VGGDADVADEIDVVRHVLPSQVPPEKGAQQLPRNSVKNQAPGRASADRLAFVEMTGRS